MMALYIYILSLVFDLFLFVYLFACVKLQYFYGCLAQSSYVAPV